jgi:hypothetical protein
MGQYHSALRRERHALLRRPVGRQTAQLDAADSDRAAADGRPSEEGHQKRRLAGAVLADDGHRFAFVDLEVDIAKDHGIAVARAQTLEVDEAHAAVPK